MGDGDPRPALEDLALPIISCIGEISILDVWRRLGGGELRGSRGKAFWRRGDGFSVSLNLEKNCYYDHRDGCGGGIVALVETALGYSRADAVKWLVAEFNLPDQGQLTHEDRAALERQRADRREMERFDEQLEPSYRAFLRELETRRDELIAILRKRDDVDAEIELAFAYHRIQAMRDALQDFVDADAVELTETIVNLIAEKS